MPGLRLLALAYAILAFAWIFTEAPGAGPDEPANYVKAVAAGRGQLLGRPGPLPKAQAVEFGLTAPRYEFANATTRWVVTPPNLAPVGFACNAFKPEASAVCVQQAHPQPSMTEQPIYVGTYQPFIYVVPGLLTRFATSPTAGVLLSRLAIWLITTGLLILAIWLLADHNKGRYALLGLVLALTPEVVWLMSIVNASGPEVCAAVCFIAGLLRLARPHAPTRGVWVALMAGGVVLALSRPLGSLWLVLDTLLIVLLLGPTALVRRIRQGGAISAIAIGVIIMAAALGFGWELAIQPHQHVAVSDMLSKLAPTLVWLPDNIQEGIGVFGWLDTYMPAAGYVLWLALLIGLMLLAWALGTARQRRILLLLEALAIAVTVGLGAAVLEPAGFVVQSRYVMAFGLAFPLYVGEVIYLNSERLASLRWRFLLPAVGLGMATLQGLAWFVNAHRQAVGAYGPLTFWIHSEWAPPLGWLPWFGLVALGCLGLVGVSLAPLLNRTSIRTVSQVTAAA